MANKQTLIKSLEIVLADTYALYLKTQNYHWNVTGMAFKSLHELFESQYTELLEPIDEIAERIRTLGARAPGSFEEFSTLKTIREATPQTTAEQMLKHLHDDQAAIVKVLNKALEQAHKHNDEASIDLLIGRIATHEKNQWMLAATLGTAAAEEV